MNLSLRSREEMVKAGSGAILSIVGLQRMKTQRTLTQTNADSFRPKPSAI
jgi:hypothetical protein